MEFEVALVEVISTDDFLRSLLPTTRVVVYFLTSDSLCPPQDSQQLVDYTFSDRKGLQKFHLVAQTDLEFGYKLCQLQRYRPMIYTARADVTPLRRLGLILGGRWESAMEMCEDTDNGEVSSSLVAQLHLRVKHVMMANPDVILSIPPSVVLAHIRTLSADVVKANPCGSRAALIAEDLAEKVYGHLSEEGLLPPLRTFEQTGSTRGWQETQLPEADGPILSVKREGLSKYIQLTLLDVMQRATKEKAARNQFATFLRGLMVALRQRSFQEIPDEYQLVSPMFEHLKTTGVIAIQGASVVYNDKKIALLAASPELQEEVVRATPEVRPPSNLRLSVLYRAFSAYYDGILTAEECKGRTEGAVKQQIRNNVRHCLSAARRENPAGELPHEDDITTAIFQALVSNRAINRQGNEVRYNSDSIGAIGRKLASMTLFTEADVPEPAVETVQKRILMDRVLVSIRGDSELTVGKLETTCQKSVLALRFDARGAMSAAMEKALVAEVMRSIVTEGGFEVLLPSGLRLETVLADTEKFRHLLVSSPLGDVYSEDLDA